MSDTPNFDDMLLTFRQNMWPAMYGLLAEQLGGSITTDAIRRLGVGYYPAEEAWIFPERNEHGVVTGLIRRYANGKKATWKGSKRGLSYECVSVREGNEFVPTCEFVRVGTACVPCPVCGRENDGCLVSDDDPDDPRAVICVRESAGSIKRLPSSGYLHHRHPHSNDGGGAVSVLPVSSKPLVITEGASDALAAMSMGYVAIGIPQAGAASPALRDLVRGKDVIIVGDRDAHQVGQKGMEAVFETIKPVCESARKVLSPEPFKDLRAWAPSAEIFEQHVTETADTSRAASVIDNDGTYGMMLEWLKAEQMKGDHRLLHCVHDELFTWDGKLYRKVEKGEAHCWWYEWFQGRQIKKPTKSGVELVDVKPNRRFVQDIEHAVHAKCFVPVRPDTHEPFLIQTGTSMDLDRAVVFRNGIYYVDRNKLEPITADIFLTTTLPYDFDPRLKHPTWDWAVVDWFNGAQDCIDLLQEWMGYCLIASNHMEAMMYLFGNPGSGKSTVARVLEALLGPDRSCSADTSSFTNLFGPGKLLNKYIAIMNESRATNRYEIDKLLQAWKTITGGDTVNINRKYADAFDARLFCRLMYVANELLPFDDASQSMCRRTNLLHFPNRYADRGNKPDRALKDKLVAEAPGIAIWALEGLRRLLDRGEFTVPKSSEEHLRDISELTNPVGLMMSECCEFHVGADFFRYKARFNELHDLWIAWCKATNTRNTMNQIAFGMKLNNLPQDIKRKRFMENGERFYAYQGVKITDAAKRHYLGA